MMTRFLSGAPLSEVLPTYPAPTADELETLRPILSTLRRYGETNVHSTKWDREGLLPEKVMRDMAEFGLLGLTIPEKYGGQALSLFAYGRIVQALAELDSSLAMTAGAHQSIGFKALQLYGDDAQKARWFPRLASGELIACYAITEANAGSDIASMESRAVLSPDGRSFRLNGSKLFITNGAITRFLTVVARTNDAGARPGKKDALTCFAIELPRGGVTIGPPADKMGVRASSTTPIYFDDVEIPVEDVIGKVGQGLEIVAGVMNHGRFSLAAGCVGAAKRALASAAARAKERVQFRQPIENLAAIQSKIARVATDLFVAESMVFLTAEMLDRQSPDAAIESAAVKIFATEMLWRATDEALQIWGGMGFMREAPVEQWVRDARVQRIFEGTNEVLRSIISAGAAQVMIPQVHAAAKGLSVEEAERLFAEREAPADGESYEAAIAEGRAKLFAAQARSLHHWPRSHDDVRSYTHERIADVVIDLYALIAVRARLERLTDDLARTFATAHLHRARARIQQNIDALFDNQDLSARRIARAISERGAYPFEVLGAL